MFELIINIGTHRKALLAILHFVQCQNLQQSMENAGDEIEGIANT